ncbi:MAG TPA: general secretion pathway protein GspK [Nitrospirae bacterium]|nr:general secretion pathway protein K [bacterium BMS3Abin10]GBE38104.1 general secretion pathway protein K [bacterium BMS3Bbin08]HDH49801.1 general secretion pathway protein GspK [Nitrospirota bacterium]HDK41382.1 general secretion pathway protein GspK [Nitrospirota bacterium]HDZ83687.1 general secretion pathway protein GspK [Nitrospirota bacterium]
MRRQNAMVNYRLSIVNQQGTALIITLLIVTLLAGLAVEFAYEVYVSTSALSNWRNAQKASLTAKSGLAFSSDYLKILNEFSYTSSRKFVVPAYKDLGENTILLVTIEDENSKFNINSIVYENGLDNEEALESLKKLFEYLNINPSLALAIADWIDPDLEPRLKNSEDKAKNQFLWSIEELALIEEVDRETFEAISPFLTVHGRIGEINININTAELPVLISLHGDMTETLAKKIIDYRESAPFENIADVVRVSGMETIGIDIQKLITVKSTDFRVTARATVNEITRFIESVIDTSMKIHYWREG